MAAPRPGQKWAGRKVQEAREWLASVTEWPTICARCGKEVRQGDAWVVGHIKDRWSHPELMWDPNNWRVEHHRCSDSSGQAAVIAKAKAEALRDAIQPALIDGFSPDDPARKSPPLPLHTLAEVTKPEPTPTREDLTWNREHLATFPWLLPLLDVPETASVPLMMTPPPSDAVDTYGWMAIEWIESTLTPRIKLRWWQKLSLVRQLEHRADGSLCHRVKVESAPRRAGKSVGLRSGSLWRMEVGPGLFGETQTVIHTGSDIPICREIQRGAWAWAEARDGWDVKRGGGQETIEAPDGSRWMVRSQDGVYGYDATLALVDEGWNVKPDTVSEGLEPAMLERSSPQLVATSTAHRRATSLMRTLIADAMTGDDPSVLLLLWGAPAGSDPSDPAVWKAASPHWSEDRRAMIAAKYEKALAGQEDPEFDDPDPMRGFEAQYLNIWRLNERPTIGNPVISELGWTGLTGLLPSRVPDAVAVEAWFGDGVSVARAWATDGPVIVAVTSHPDLPDAASYIAALGLRKAVGVGASLALHSAWSSNHVKVTKRAGTSRTAVGDLTRFLKEGKFLHNGAEILTDQVLQLRTSPGIDGPRLRSTGRMDAIKAAMWAVQDASTAVRKRPTIPSRYRRAG